MIEKMKVVHIVAAASEKTALLDRLAPWASSTSPKRPAPTSGIWSALRSCPGWTSLQEYAYRAGRPRPCPTRTLSLFIRSWPTA